MTDWSGLCVSGGPDSMALAYLVSQVRESLSLLGTHIQAYIVDHRARDGSHVEAEMTSERLRDWGTVSLESPNWCER